MTPIASLPVRSRARAGFTLIELLTVIAIIGILAAIIIPVVGQVRRSAKNSACMSNLRQWGQAIMLYANDHKGNYVIRGLSDTGTDMTWAAVSTNKNNMLYGAYFEHSSILSAMRSCPLIPDSNGGLNYVINRPYLTGSTVSPVDKVPLKQVNNPARFMLVADMANGATTANGYSMIGTGGLAQCVTPLFTDTVDTRHNRSANMVFGDGHVQGISAADITQYGDKWTRVNN